MNEILTRKLPFDELTEGGELPAEIFQRIVQDNITPSLNESSQDLHYEQVNRVITQCWSTDPNNRPSIGELQVLSWVVDSAY
jgi:hypothetical protein